MLRKKLTDVNLRIISKSSVNLNNTTTLEFQNKRIKL